MRSPLPATSQSEPLIVAAVSARALAQAARRAGLRPLVADLFGDDDTLAAAERFARLPGSLAAGIDADGVLPALEELAQGRSPAVVLGSGFEGLPDVVDRIAARFPLAGCSGSVLARVKDAQDFAAACARLGVPHPAVRLSQPDDPEGWLVKRCGAAGGLHIRPASHAANKATGKSGLYFQRLSPGESISALFIARRSGAQLVGFSRQWTDPNEVSPYRYGGAVRLRRFRPMLAAQVSKWLEALTRHYDLRGLCSADFKLSRDRLTLLEINPRPGATLDIFDDDTAPLLAAHLAACRDRPVVLPRYADSAASAVLYAGAAIPSFPPLDWPDWTSDRQRSGTTLAEGDPVCTAILRGRTAEAARRLLQRRGKTISRLWQLSDEESVPC